jgi:hypothetical protein
MCVQKIGWRKEGKKILASKRDAAQRPSKGGQLLIIGSHPAAEAGDVGGADGLEEEALGALLQAPGDAVGHVLRRHDDHGDPPEPGRLLDALEQLVPRHAGHPVVGDDHVHVGQPAEAEQLQGPRRRVHCGHCTERERERAGRRQQPRI